MDFLPKAYAQLAELLRSMSVGTRVATGLLLALVVVSLAYLFQYRIAGGDEFLLGGRPFNASELTAIEAAFAKAGLGKSQVAGSQVRIPRGQKELYLAALADAHALPADFYTYLDDAATNDNPWASSKSQEFRRATAKQKSLAHMLGKMKGIESASVHYDEETKQGLMKQKQKTAMVAVKTSGSPLDEDQLKAIRNVIASAYAGLDRHNITITDMTSGFSYGGAIGPDGLPEDENVYAQHKLRFERDWQQKIKQQLAFIPGVIVGVNAELNPEVRRQQNGVKYDPKAFAVSMTDFTKDSTNQTGQVAGRPGAQSNGVGNSAVSLQQSAGSGGESKTSESRSDTQNIPAWDQTAVQMAALTPKKVTASISVPVSYYTEVWKKRNPQSADKPAKPPEAAELATIETEIENDIKEIVRPMLPDVEQGTNPWPHIVVKKYTDLPSAPPTPPSLASSAGTWLADNWQTLALVVLALASLVMLRGMVRSAAGGSPAPAAAAGGASQPRLATHEMPADEDEPEPAKILRTRFRSSGPDLKSELQEIVKENPDAAATILRAWIGDAA